MPRKPTQSFGSIVFGKDGTVRSDIKLLAEDKERQEGAVAQYLAQHLNSVYGKTFQIIEEDTYDFRLVSDRTSIVVEATEIVSRDYLRSLSKEEFVNGNHGFTEVLFDGDNYYGVDLESKNRVLLERINNKIKKRYSHPGHPFWLLVWTVCRDFFPFYYKGAEFVVGNEAKMACEYLKRYGSSVFDEVWFLNLEVQPHRLWP